MCLVSSWQLSKRDADATLGCNRISEYNKRRCDRIGLWTFCQLASKHLEIEQAKKTRTILDDDLKSTFLLFRCGGCSVYVSYSSLFFWCHVNTGETAVWASVTNT